jgi:hypothetical protein
MVVQNDKNQARNATAIEIMMGPRIPYPADDEYATERVAILLDHNHNIWDPAKIAVGKYVELTGRMTITTPLADHSPMTRSPEARPHMVLSIIPDGPPKVLNPE